MPCVCQQICDKAERGAVQPYREGQKYCSICDTFQDPNEKNRCYCCNSKLRNKTKSRPPEKRKKSKYKDETKHGLPFVAGGRRPNVEK